MTDTNTPSEEGRARFTPGPWTIEHYGDGDSLVLHSDGNTRICFMATPGSSPRAFATIEANASLIAAAPDLVEALTEIVAHCGMTREEFVLQGPAFASKQVERAVSIAKAAISKALGADHDR